jgi:hypothetical protein
MPAETFVQIFKCIARPNFCETPACAKPLGRYLQAGRQCGETMKQKIE